MNDDFYGNRKIEEQMMMHIKYDYKGQESGFDDPRSKNKWCSRNLCNLSEYKCKSPQGDNIYYLM